MGQAQVIKIVHVGCLLVQDSKIGTILIAHSQLEVTITARPSIKIRIETRHGSDMTEKLLKSKFNPLTCTNTHTGKEKMM